MDRWSGIVRVTLNNRNHFSVAASLCFSPSTKTLIVPSANAIFFTGDRVEGTGNPVIERLSDTQNIAEILVSKLGISVNAWVVEASTFNGPFAVYKEFIPSMNSWGEPKSYNPDGFPASTSTASLLLKCLEQVKEVMKGKQKTPQTRASMSSPTRPKTIIFGFSKGGTVLNQLVTEVAQTEHEATLRLSHITKDAVRGSNSEIQEESEIIPSSKESLLSSISEIHYVDVGLNSAGAYLTDNTVIEKIAQLLAHRVSGIHFAVHGTPRQWCDSRRPWIANEKDRLLQLLEDAAQKTAGKLQVCERLYFANMLPNLQMHFEIIEVLDVS